MSLIRAPWVPAPYIAGAGPDLIQSALARASRQISVISDAVRERPKLANTRAAHADFENPQASRFPRRVPLGLADAVVGVQTDWPFLPGRLPPGGLPPGVIAGAPPAS